MSFRHPPKTPRRRPPSLPTFSPDNLSSSPSRASTSDSRSTQAHLIEIARYPRQRRPRNSKSLFLPSPSTHVVLPGGTRLTQVYSIDGVSPRRRPTLGDDNSESALNTIFDDVFTSPTLDSDINGHRRKENQWKTWTTEVIPSLLRPYLQLLRETDNL